MICLLLSMRQKEEGSIIYVINADGSGMKNLTDNSAFDVFPSWSLFLEAD